MNKKLLGGIIVLVVLIGIVGVFLLIGQNTDTEPKKVYNPPSKEVMQKIRDDLAARKAQEAATPQSQVAKTETGHRHADGTWHEGTHDTPVAEKVASDEKYTLPEKYRLPDDVFSEAYTEKLKSLVQICVELYHLPKEERKARGYDDAWVGMHNGWNDASDLINHYFLTYDETYSERYEEIMKIIEPFKALVPRPNTPMPESLQRAKALTPEMSDKIDEIWRKP